jgi:hypothetical protein
MENAAECVTVYFGVLLLMPRILGGNSYFLNYLSIAANAQDT